MRFDWLSIILDPKRVMTNITLEIANFWFNLYKKEDLLCNFIGRNL